MSEGDITALYIAAIKRSLGYQAMIFSKGKYFVETNNSPQINLLFAALFDLNICRITKMGILIPCAVEGHDVDAIFAKKVPKVKDDKSKKWLVGSIGGSD